MEPIEEFDEAFGKFRENMKDVTSATPVIHTSAEVFNQIFRHILWSEPPGRQSEEEVQGASRSNWTFHIAFAIKRAAQIMNLSCRFETRGRLDAVIETIEEKPRVVLLAEWEWDPKSIFGKGKELEKLWKGTSNLQHANALLFTYCPASETGDFVKAVTAYWQERAARRKKGHPILYLNIAVYNRDSSVEVIEFIGMIEVHAEGVKVWGGPFLCRSPYL